jgi:PKD repeat protein
VTTTHGYSVPGTYVVTLTVTDNAGQTGFATQTVTVTAPGAPQASFSISPPNPTAPSGTNASVFFDGRGSSVAPGRSIVSYSWSTSNGLSGSGSTFTGLFRAPGTYTVTLTVTDNTGAVGSLTQSITVSAS